MSAIQLIVVFVLIGIFVYSVYGVKGSPKDGEGANKKKRNIFLGISILSVGLVLGICMHVNHVQSVNGEIASDLASGITVQFKDDSPVKQVYNVSANEYNIKTKDCKYEFEFHLDGSYIVGVKDVKQLSCKEKSS